MLSMNLMVTTNQKCVIDTQKNKKNPSVILKKVIKSQGKRARKEERYREELEKQSNNYQNNKSTY